MQPAHLEVGPVQDFVPISLEFGPLDPIGNKSSDSEDVGTVRMAAGIKVSVEHSYWIGA